MGIGSYAVILVALVGLLAGYIIGQDCTIHRVQKLMDNVIENIKKQEQDKEEQRAKGMAALSDILNNAKLNQTKKEQE